MRFSVITPSYNQGRFIRQCLESVRSQGVEVEHIVVDAQSTDETLEVLRDFPDVQWTSEPDKGQSDAINKGFQRATGDWVMWLNADDFLLPGALAAVAKAIEAHRDADVLYGGWHFVDATARVLKTSRVFPIDRRMMVYYGCYIGSTSCFFKRSTIIVEGHLLNTDFRQTMDQEYYLRLLFAGKRFQCLPEVLAGFRVHGDNASMRSANATTIDGRLRQQKLWAEGDTLRRHYGQQWLRHPIYEPIWGALAWTYYRWKKVLLKLRYGGYRKKDS